jgi:tetratricopeptide (TPR) repeat protein/DNA-binding CsgD family transcriptional regulator
VLNHNNWSFSLINLLVLIVLFSNCKQQDENSEQSHNSDTIQVNLLLDSSQVYLTDNIPKAESFAKKALVLSKKIEYTKGIAYSCFMIATIFSDFESDMDESHMMESMSLAKQLNDSILIARLYNLIGKKKGYSNETNKSLKYYNRALGIFLRHGQDSLAAGVYNNIGIEYQNVGNDSMSKYYFMKAIRINEETRNLFWLAVNYLNMGVRLTDMGEYTEALTFATKCQAISEANKYTILLPFVYNNFCMIYSSTGDSVQALHYAYQAMKYSKINKNIYIEYTIFQALNQLYKRQRKIDSAYHFQAKAMILKDSISDLKKTKGIELMELKFEYQHEILLNKIQQEKKQNTFLLIIIVLILLVGVSTVLYLLQRARIREKMLETERLNTEKRIMQNDIEMKSKELACNMIHMTDKNQLINKVIETLSESNNEQQENYNPTYQRIISELNHHQKKNHWEGFDKEFSQVSPNFYINLLHDFPTLTQNEKRLCAFIKLNMNTKEIAEILHVDYYSAFKARTRLRKKMNLTGTDENLISFISKY